MRVVDRGALAGYISMNRSWAGFDYEDYYRASQIAMGILDEELDADLGKEYLPEGGHRIGGLVDDHGIAQIARDLTAAEQEIKNELEGKTAEESDSRDTVSADRAFQVVNGNMFSRVHEPVLRISTCNLLFSVSCVSRLPGAETVELLFNPVERMIVVRPCAPDHPNAMPWNAAGRGASPLCKTIYDSMGWDAEYAYRIPCQTVTHPSGAAVLVFDLDNFIGRATSKKEEVTIARKQAEAVQEEREDAKSYYYPPDEDEPQEIKDMEVRFMQAVEENKRRFGTPVFQHVPGMRGLGVETSEDEWDMLIEARPLDITHTVDAETVDGLLETIKKSPPEMPVPKEPYPEEIIVNREEAE